jgi:hypothetical protein
MVLVPFFIVLSMSFLLLELVKGSVNTKRTSGPRHSCRLASKTLIFIMPVDAIIDSPYRPLTG